MSEPVPTKPSTFARLNSRGLIEIIDIHTGRILCIQSTAEDLLSDKWDRLTRIDTEEGAVYIERGLSLDLVLKKHLRAPEYSAVLGDLVAEKIVGGSTLVKACEDLGVKYSDLCRWKREQPEFAEKLSQARKDRAEALHDEMLERARHGRTSARTHIEALQYAMEKGDPETFAQKPGAQPQAQGNVTLIIATGISRELPPGVAGEVREVGEAPAEKNEILIPEELD